MAVGTGGEAGGGGGNILRNRKVKCLKSMTYKSVYSNKAKIGS